MKKLLMLFLAAMLVFSVAAPCALAADTGEQPVAVVEEAAPDVEAAVDADADAPAPAPSEKIYSTRNLVIGGVSIGVMAVALIIIRVKMKKG